nr:MAG TPA: tail protein [Caudoviricetes sp.]
MLNINKNYTLSVNLKTSKVDIKDDMIFRNTDVGIANIYVNLNYEGLTGIYKDLSIEPANNITVELAIIKPKSYEFIILHGKVVSEENYIYEFILPSECTDLIGKYDCELRIYATVGNEEESLTSESFIYTVKPSIATELNEQIQVNPDLPILEKLIKEVKELSLNIENDSVQMKRDKNLVGDNKTVVGAINNLLLKGTGSGGTVDLSKLLDDENISTTSTWSSNKIQNELVTLKDDITYVPITINSFKTSLSKTVYELGVDTLTSVPLTWSLSKTPKTISISDCSNVSPSISFVTYTGNIKNTKTFTLTVTDEKGNTKTANTTIYFVNAFYYGTYDNVINEGIIKAQNKIIEMKGNKSIKLSYNDKQVFFAYPKSYGVLKLIKDGNGFNYMNAFIKGEISINNIDYYIYKLEEKATASNISYTFSF